MVDTTPGSPPREPETDATEAHVEGPLVRSSWSAIFAGAFCGLAIYLVLGLIGLAFGIGSIDPAEEAQPLSGVPFGLGVWWVLSGIAAFFVGGAIAGRLAGFPKSTAGALNGLTVGAVMLLFISWLATSTIGSAVTGAAGAVAQLFGDGQAVNVTLRQQPVRIIEAGAAGAAGAAAAGAAGGDAARAQQQYEAATRVRDQIANTIRNEARQIYDQLVSPAEERRLAQQAQSTYADIIKTPGDARQDVREFVRFLLSNEGVMGPEDREQAKEVLMKRLGVPEADADRVLDRWQRQYQQATANLQNLANSVATELNQYAEAQGIDMEAPLGIAPAVRRVVGEQQARRTGQIVQRTAADILENPANAYSRVQLAFERLFGQDGVWGQEDVKELRAVLREEFGLTEAQVERFIDRWQEQYQQAVQAVEQTYQEVERTVAVATDRTMDQIAETTGWTAFAMLLALAAAAGGGMLGRPDDRFAWPDREALRRLREGRSLGPRDRSETSTTTTPRDE